MNRFQVLLLILAASFFGTLLYVINTAKVTNPASPVSPVVERTKNPLKIFDRDVTILLLGDIMLGRSVMIKSLDLGDPAYPFRKVAHALAEADIVFANLESPIISNCPRIEHGFTFCADPRMVEGLVHSGVDVVSLANNHMGNFGKRGIEETEKILNENGIKWVGVGNLEIIEKKGVKFGFLGFDLTTKALTEADLELVRNADKKVNILIVGVHWGEEYKGIAGSVQRIAAQKMVEGGADVVVGHHPHWVQDIEYLHGRPIYYSLGNFVFDQMWSEETRKGQGVRLTFRDGEIKKEERLPTYIKNWSQPELIE